MNGKTSFCKVINNGERFKTVELSEEEEAKVRTLHDVECLRILRTCLENGQLLSENPDRSLRIALALFDERCDTV